MSEHAPLSSDVFGTWKWDAGAQQLTLEPTPDSTLQDLGGIWTLEAFSVQLDGLSRSRLGRTLEATSGNISCALGLSDGRRVQLLGQFDTTGLAEGVLAQSKEKNKTAKPGPVLTPVYQPIISLHTGQTAGFEALARWTGGTDASFEDPALATNMLIHAAQALSVWHKATSRKDLFMQVNLTARDLATADVADLIGELVAGYNLPSGSIRIELTEQAALRDMERALETVKAIKAVGATLVLDDFGSGHSSFAWLADMPADALKIDSSLTQRIGDTRTEHILEAITLLASRLGMSVTAEGVEDKAMIGRLRQLGFTYIQGFALSRPMEEGAVLAFLESEI